MEHASKLAVIHMKRNVQSCQLYCLRPFFFRSGATCRGSSVVKVQLDLGQRKL
jgi:hypothetical protein